MQKLRLSNDEKKTFLEKIANKLALTTKLNANDFDITDITKEMQEIPKDALTPIVVITAEAYIKMIELIRQSEVEISWHGLVKRNKEEGAYLVYDILVFPQENSSTTTTAKEDEFAEWMMNYLMDPEFPIEDLRMHGHSHVNMSVFSSGVDDAYQKDILTKVEDGDYYLFLIMNKRLEICALLYDFDQQILFENKDIEIEIITNDDVLLRDWARKTIKENCTTVKSMMSSKKSGYFYDEEKEWYKNYYSMEDDISIINPKSSAPIKKKGKKHGSK
jgi:hypothetical protein